MAGFNHFAEIAKALEPACSRIVSNTAKAGKGHVQGHIQANGQVATGFLLSSVYASTPEGSDYSGGTPEVTPPDKTTAIIGVGASYGGYQNYGTRYIAARPFFEPGIDDTRGNFVAELGKLESYLMGGL